MKILFFLSILLGFLLTNSELSQGANLSIRKSGPSIANPGDLVTYTITYSNTASTLEDHVVITDYLPDASNCTYYSSFPSGVYNSDLNTLTWNSTQIPVLASLDAGSGENTIQVTLRMGKLGTGINLSGVGYYLNTSSVTLNSYTEIKSDQTTTSVLSDPVPTIVSYNCSFKISQPGAGIKSATGSTLTYLVALTNTGNIYQKYSLNSSMFSGQYLEQYIQDLNGVAISGTPFVAPGGTYFFHYVLKTPEQDGTKPNEYTETKITATPNICGDPQEAIYNTFIYGGSYSKYELLSVYKIDTSDPVQSGSQLTYQIVISNVGDPLDDVRLTEAYPDNTTFISASTSTPSVTTGNNIWDFSVLPSGNTIITVTLDVANGLPNGTILNNTVEVSSGGKTYDTYTEQTTVASAPDLTITKTASVVNSPAGPGSTVNYTLTYTNIGNYPASGIVIKDNYDGNYMNIKDIGAGINAGNEIIWNISGSLNPGKSNTIHYSMSIEDNPLLFLNGSTNIINSAVISSNLFDRNVSDNTATATVNVFVLPDLKIEKEADPAIGLVNQPITYTLTVSNKGKLNHAGSTYTVVDYLPLGTTYLSSTPSGATYSSGAISWTISEDLPVNGTKSFTVTLDALPCSFVESGTLTNNAAVSSNLYGDAENSNNAVTLITDVVDKENPTISSPDPVSVNNDSGKCSAEVTLAKPVTADNCEILSITNDHASTTFPVGTTTVKWTVTDIHGNVTTANQSVIVKDVSAPVADMESLATITGDCSVIVPVPTATDHCEGVIMGKTENALIYSAQGTYTIDWTYDDGKGNISTQPQTVVVKDITAPVADMESLPIVTGECSATVSAPTATDNCKGPIVGTTEDPTTYSIQGTYTIYWKYDDGNGNTYTQPQTVVVKDITAPVADQQTLPTVTGECSATVSAPTATDNCKGTVVGTTEDPTTYSIEGTYTIHWIYADGNGNTSSQTQTVVVDDITPPETPVLADVIVGECSGTPDAPTTTDNCQGTVIGTTTTEFPITTQGTTVVTWTFDDGHNNVITAQQNVIVDDTTAPVADQQTLPTVTGECGATVSAPTATDNCKGPIVGTTEDPTTYSIQGTYTIHWKYDDGNGNTSTQTQTVVVDDVTSPVADLAVLPTLSGQYILIVPFPTATDNCSGSVTGSTSDPLTYTEQGTYTVHWTYADGNGNTSTQTQTVVVEDTTAPDTPMLADIIVGECSGTPTLPTTTDNGSKQITGTTTTVFPITTQGTTVVTWTFDDGHGNVTTARQNVIVDDVTAPVADQQTLPTLTDECSVSVVAPTATDNCKGTVVGTTEDPITYSIQGTYTIHWTYADGNGNTSTQSQIVVVDDITPPETPVLADVIVGECSGTPPTPSTIDNCAGIVMGKTSIIFPKTKQGESTIIWTFDDGNGNVVSAYQNLIVDDITAPVADQQTLPTVTGECSATVSAPTATDNCKGTVVGTTEDPTTYSIEGTYTIHWMYDDGNGNTSSQTQTVVVDDITPPETPVLADVIVGECSGTPEAPTTTDNCQGTVIGITTTEFPITTQGTTVVTWNFDDGSGNVITANQNVIVIDHTPPVIAGTLAPSTVEGCDVANVTAPVTTISELEAMGITVSDACTANDALRVTSNDIHSGISPIVVTRTYTITDAYDNFTTSSQSIRIVDSKKPTITLASPLASYPSNNGLCTYKVTGTQLDPVAAADNCSVKSVTNSFNNSSSLKDAMFPTGLTKVIWTVEDAGGNNTSASYDIVVVDTQNPQITCAEPSMSYPSDPGVCSYKVTGTNLDPKVITDNCSVKSVANDFNKASSLKDAIFPIGTTKVTWTVEDVNGNKSRCVTDIVVVDTQNPVIQCSVPKVDYTYQTPGTELDPIVADNCGVASIINDFTNSASLQGAKFLPGINVVKWTATDHSGNKSTCSVTIEVDDILPPTITCAPVTAVGYAADQGVCTYKVSGIVLDPSIDDNYSEVDVVNNFNHRASLNEALFPLGETTVIWTATDKSGNSSTCTQVIKVNDTQKPTITAPANLNVKADAGKCTASALALGTPVTADNCSVASVTNDAPEIFPLGQTVVTWTVTDKSGNKAISAQTVVVERLLIAVDDQVSLKEDNQVTGNVLANDAGLCNVATQVKSHSEPAHGELTMADNGDFTYIPDENYHGTDKFTYQICSSQGECSEATVTITVESVNDLPIAMEDKHTIQLDLVLQGDVADNDIISGDGVNVWTIVDQPAHGTILFHPDGTYTYTPNNDFLGSDSFTYKLCDADGDCSQTKVSVRIEDVLLPNQILTPNGDDVNDTFIIVGIDLYPQNKLTMYNRWGNVVYQKNNYQNEWDGNSNMSKIGSKSLPVGTYYYLIDYGKGRHKTGFVYLDR